MKKNHHSSQIESQCVEAQNLFDTNKIDDCKKIINNILKEDHSNTKANELLAYIFKNRKDNNSALHHLKIACEDKYCSIASLYYLGKLYIEEGEYQNALKYINESIIKAGEFIEGLNDIGLVHFKMGNYKESIINLTKAVSYIKNESYVYVYLNLSLAYSKIKNYDLALNYLNIATEISPKYIEAWTEKANVLNSLNRNQEALSVINSALKIANGPKIQITKGIILISLEREKDALFCFKKALELDKNSVEAWNQSGLVLIKLEEYDAALNSFNNAIYCEQDNFEALLNKGLCLNFQKKYKEALETWNHLNTIFPINKYVLTNIGVALTNLNRSEDSIPFYDEVIEIDPELSDAYANKGEALNILKEYEEANENFKKAFYINKNMPLAHLNYAFTNFMLNELESAWTEYEWRWKIDTKRNPKIITNKPQWDGKDRNIDLLIWGEQGIGEQVLFGSMLSEINNLNELNTTVLIDKKLLPLFKNSFSNIKFLERNIDISKLEFEEQISIGDLGKYFRNTIEKFSNVNFPYLKNNKKYEKSNINKVNKIITCGISWHSYGKDFGKEKSIPLKQFETLFELPNTEWINLQYNVSDHDKSIISGGNIKFVELVNNDMFNDIENLVHCVQNCDVVVTCSNTTAHIAGALGKKTLLLLPFRRGRLFYWKAINGKCIWYPSVTIFNQETLLNWHKPISDVRFELMNLIQHISVMPLKT
jgi:tetratricopeptide (TPR) repeat protein